jgi:hypothetical protein
MTNPITPTQPLTDDELRRAINSLGFHDDRGQELVLRDPDTLKLLHLFQAQASLREREADRLARIDECNFNRNLHQPLNASDEYRKGFDDAIDQVVRCDENRVKLLREQSAKPQERRMPNLHCKNCGEWFDKGPHICKTDMFGNTIETHSNPTNQQTEQPEDAELEKALLLLVPQLPVDNDDLHAEQREQAKEWLLAWRDRTRPVAGDRKITLTRVAPKPPKVNDEHFTVSDINYEPQDANVGVKVDDSQDDFDLGDGIGLEISVLMHAVYIDAQNEHPHSVVDSAVNQVLSHIQASHFPKSQALLRKDVEAAIEDTTALRQYGIIWLDYDELKQRLGLATPEKEEKQ